MHYHYSLLKSKNEKLPKRFYAIIAIALIFGSFISYRLFLSSSLQPSQKSPLLLPLPSPPLKIQFSLNTTSGNNDLKPALDSLVSTLSSFPNFKGFLTTTCTNVSSQYRIAAEARYDTLRPRNGTKPTTYYIAMNLYNSEDLIPDLIYQLTQVFQIIGPENTFISIYENASTDHTKALLRVFQLALSLLGVEHQIQLDSDTPSSRDSGDRIENLARIRQQAMNPLLRLKEEGRKYDHVIFINDIFVCRNDILELIYQQRLQKSHMTCGMDFGDIQRFPPDPRFYDVWVSRDITGTPFTFNWEEGVVKDKGSHEKFQKNEPFQAYCCWNGMAVLDTTPIYTHNITFRAGTKKDACDFASECTYICEDFWQAGYGRIVVVPRVKVAYDRPNFEGIHRSGARKELGPRDKMFSPAENKTINWVEKPDEWYCSFEREKWVKTVVSRRDPLLPTEKN